MTFRKKNIFITGASSGIGEALALILAKEAAAIVLVARRQNRLDKLSMQLQSLNPELKIIVLAKDITNEQQQIEMAAELVRQRVTIDILINNAGVGDDAFFKKC